MHIMLDLETLSTRMDAAILSIGAVRFTPAHVLDYTFYSAVTIDSNLESGRHVAGATLAWWVQQDGAAREAFGDPQARHLNAALHALSIWIGGAAGPDDEEVYLWGNGANFDISILESAYRNAQHIVPWNFRNVRCLRTIRALAGAETIDRPENPIAHHALEDARAQAVWLQRAWAAGIGRVEGN